MILLNIIQYLTQKTWGEREREREQEIFNTIVKQQFSLTSALIVDALFYSYFLNFIVILPMTREKALHFYEEREKPSVCYNRK
jgi:hypothetical protein